MNATVAAVEAVLLICAGMTALFVLYFFLLWCFAYRNQFEFRRQEKRRAYEGLSASELEKLPKLTGKDLVMVPECAICLEQIESDHPARLLPGCNHGFHLHCVDTWLSRNSVCPVCKIKINNSENPC